jgi:CBS domain-containing protein/gamma-glutamyl:cysteine ligase YbdK (ATP-grasp superfamily)
MGDFHVRRIRDKADRRQAYVQILDDLKAFEIMLAEGRFDNGPIHIGAEQELCIVDHQWQPAARALEILAAINDPHYTNELALYNLEINLDPVRLRGRCFRDTEQSLRELIAKGQRAAAEHGAQIMQCGILPTLKFRHLQFSYMTPEERYRTLSETLYQLRGSKFEIYLQGVDELILSLGSVLFEACNTSFQLHLQIPADRFATQHNWSQMIAGPVLAACANSPLLFGRELWAETRIALFKQSMDTRSSERYIRSKLARVYFGLDWLRNSPAEIWRNNLSRFPLLLTSDGFETATEVLARGGVPDLRAIRLQNGTTYTWNRLCYGPTRPQPHLRIECRYLPAGPSTLDEMANFALWAGLMQADFAGKEELPQRVAFRTAKDNFIKAARTGLGTTFKWYGRLRPAKELLLETLIPLARQGLEQQGVATADIDTYLGVITRRVERETTGADWLVRNYRLLSKSYGNSAAEAELTRASLAYQAANTPVHEWEDFRPRHTIQIATDQTVEYLMSRDVLTVAADDCIEQAARVMEWHGIHHLPVEDEKGALIGLLTDGQLQRHRATDESAAFVGDIMLTELTTVAPQDSIQSLIDTLEKEKLSGLPVVSEGKLVGMITTKDTERLLAQSGREIA